MIDLERELRSAMNAAVADAEPRGDIMELVRQRHRRRNLRMLAATAIVVAVIAAAVPLIGRARSGPPAHPPALHVRFPGGGRILLRSHGDLRWLYPDGRSVTIASGYAGATLAGRKLLAWKNTGQSVGYYTMSLNGSNPKLVISPDRPVANTRVYHVDLQPSPDGSRLAYLRVEQRRNGTQVASELWSIDLATGRKTDLGSYSGPIMWRDNKTIIVGSSGSRSIQVVNATDGSKATYLTIHNARVIQAYRRARPLRGTPAFITPDSLNSAPSPAVLAVSVADSANTLGVQLLLEQRRVLAFAPDLNSIDMLTWGHHGVFLVHTGEGDNPGSWNTYTGTLQSPHLSSAETFGDPWDTAMFNPRGDVIAFFYGNGDIVAFAPVVSPACQRTGECMHFQPKALYGQGTLLAWAR